MKYPKLNSLIPEGEHFDETAISGEGVWLSTGHVNSIEQALASDEAAAGLISANASIETLNETVSTLNSTISSLETAANTSAETIAARDARIQELEGQVAVLGKQSSGNGTAVITKKDETAADQKPVPSYLDDNNPVNQFADKRLRRQASK